MKSKHVTYLIFYGFIAIVLGVVLWHTGKMMVVKGQMERYLRAEYGKEFVVSKVYYVYPYLGGSLEIEGLAYAKDDPDLKFEISKSASDNDPNTRFYSEGYIQEFWEKQMRNKVKQKLNNDIVWADIAAYYKVEEISGRTIDIEEAEQLFKGRIDLYISYGELVSLDEYNNGYEDYRNLVRGNLSQTQAKNLYRMVKELQNSSYKEINLEINYFDLKYREEIEKNPKEYLSGNVSYDELPTYKEDALLCQFCIQNINRINSPEDIGRSINLKSIYLHQRINE